MKAFRIEGEFLMKDKWQKFVREVASKDKKSAMEYILSDIGGRHRTKRKNVKIHDVKQIKPEEIQDQFVKDTLEGDRGDN
ncbi:MAG: 50S ribosomal protein L18a [Methanobacteriota archaeon]|nr:MAG: 50S ribosomal protein L18a [Euryarchaeota archaeon]